MIQGPDSVNLFYLNLKRFSKNIGHDNEDYFKQQFLRVLSPENQLEATRESYGFRCGTDLPLEGLVVRLSAIEDIRKMNSICA